MVKPARNHRNYHRLTIFNHFYFYIFNVFLGLYNKTLIIIIYN
jgi:hypothetical protein